jgi:formylglycine-generating enzyme required for sulfatase activity
LTEELQTWPGTPEPLATLLREEDWVITLPSEAEWEKAARGGERIPNLKSQGPGLEFQGPKWVKNPERGRDFPWGEEPDPNRANYADTGIGATSAVGCFPGGASPCGVQDLGGNVWEWTRSLWGRDWGEPEFGYPYDPGDGRENLEAERSVLRVLRGGAFDFGAGSVRCASRLRLDPSIRYGYDGFRVVASPVRLWPLAL